MGLGISLRETLRYRIQKYQLRPALASLTGKGLVAVTATAGQDNSAGTG